MQMFGLDEYNDPDGKRFVFRGYASSTHIAIENIFKVILFNIKSALIECFRFFAILKKKDKNNDDI